MRIPDIVLVAPVLDVSGTAEVARNLYLSLFNLGAKVKIIEIPYWSHLKTELNPEVRDKIQFGIDRSDIQDPAVIHFYPPDPYKGMINVGARIQVNYTVFETDKCPVLWRDVFNNPVYQECWVACDFQAEAYSLQGVNKSKIKVIPFGVDTNRFNPNIVPLKIRGKKPFTFMTALDWSVRKNPENMVAAYMQEFTNDEDVCFVIKSYTGYGDEAAANSIRVSINKLRAMLRSKANVLFIPQFLSSDLMPHLHKSADAWVNFARGEGWDLGSIQSLACGVPVVGSDNSSHKVYLNNTNSYLVPCQKTQITNTEFLSKSPQFIGHSWWEPNLKEARKAMRQVYNDWKDGSIEIKKTEARNTALNFNWKRTAIRILFELGKYY